ncbi:hypothetical protein L6452_22965 [Arctium lappa]|uniref:Uncharacterized protein n=1 Tax=Arctium lappa TaxID=4217 RepID=A0ACB9B1V5_ARCLA|nr:hypothetical protein L6452_22965 [Arctium lappa]
MGQGYPPVAPPPQQGYPNQGYGYYPPQYYQYPQQGYPTQYTVQYVPPPQYKQSNGFMKGCLYCMSCASSVDEVVIVVQLCCPMLLLSLGCMLLSRQKDYQNFTRSHIKLVLQIVPLTHGPRPDDLLPSGFCPLHDMDSALLDLHALTHDPRRCLRVVENCKEKKIIITKHVEFPSKSSFQTLIFSHTKNPFYSRTEN